jgi:hypothetical protein
MDDREWNRDEASVGQELERESVESRGCNRERRTRHGLTNGKKSLMEEKGDAKKGSELKEMRMREGYNIRTQMKGTESVNEKQQA